MQPQLPSGKILQACTRRTCSWPHLLSLFLEFMCVCACTVCGGVCLCVRVFFHGPERSQRRQGLRECRSPAYRGKNSFLESYTSTGICLMSARVEICIEHVRRPLVIVDSITDCGCSLCLPVLAPFICSFPLTIINETKKERAENNGEERGEKGKHWHVWMH